MAVLWRSFLTGTSDFEKIERTSATISGVGDPIFPTALRTFKLLSSGVHDSGVEKSWNLQFVAHYQDTMKTFIKNVCSKWGGDISYEWSLVLIWMC